MRGIMAETAGNARCRHPEAAMPAIPTHSRKGQARLALQQKASRLAEGAAGALMLANVDAMRGLNETYGFGRW